MRQVLGLKAFLRLRCTARQPEVYCCALAPVAEAGAMITRTITLSVAW